MNYELQITGCRQQSRGFTLIEVVVAVTITGLIAAVVYGSLIGVMQTTKEARERMELYQSARFTLWSMSEEISSSFMSEENVFKGSDAEFGDYDGCGISFSSTVKGLSPGQGGISRRGYYLNRRTLFKSVDGKIYPIVEGVDNLSLCYFDGLNWVDSWDSRVKHKLPELVEIDLELGGEPFSISIAIPVRGSLSVE